MNQRRGIALFVCVKTEAEGSNRIVMLNIKQIAEAEGVEYHHHDSFKTPPYKNVDDLENAIHVVYPAPYAPWVLAINVDGSVSRPGDKLRSKFDTLISKIEGMLG